jgi:Spy/CpxP family protein refolding chaperone
MKLNRTKKIIAGAALAGSLMLTGLVGFAQQQQAARGQGDQEGAERHERGDKEGFGGRFAEKLNLTDAQKEQMKQISARFHESTKALRQQGHENRGGGGFDAFKEGTFNESAVRAAAQARANAQVEMEVARARMMYEMYNVLTPEQKAQLTADRQQREQKRQEWRARRGANSNQDQ